LQQQKIKQIHKFLALLEK
jgi:hypothetical protein